MQWMNYIQGPTGIQIVQTLFTADLHRYRESFFQKIFISLKKITQKQYTSILITITFLHIKHKNKLQ